MNRIMDEVLFNMLLACSVVVAFNLAGLDATNSFSVELLTTLYNLFCVLAMTFVYCFLSEEVTSKLSSIGHAFYASIWYEWPVQQQRLVILPILRATKSFRLNSLGLIDCSLSVFSSVCSDFVDLLRILFV